MGAVENLRQLYRRGDQDVPVQYFIISIGSNTTPAVYVDQREQNSETRGTWITQNAIT